MADGRGASLFAQSVSVALTAARDMPIEESVVLGCLHPGQRPADALFERAWRGTLASLSRAERVGRLNGVTGHVGESVLEVMLEALGYHVLWHFIGPMSGGHGVDVLVLSPDENVVAIEVKATLRAGRWPRPSRGELTQMTSRWLDKADNPGMANWDLASADVYGAVAVVNFAACAWRCAVTADFMTALPVTGVAQLADLSWLRNGG
jgi:hypothetical protein